MRHCAFRALSMVFCLFTFLLPFSLYAQNQVSADGSVQNGENGPSDRPVHHPREDRLLRGKPFHGDVRTLPQVHPKKFERPEFEEPNLVPALLPGTEAVTQTGAGPLANAPSISAPA